MRTDAYKPVLINSITVSGTHNELCAPAIAGNINCRSANPKLLAALLDTKLTFGHHNKIPE